MSDARAKAANRLARIVGNPGGQRGAMTRKKLSIWIPGDVRVSGVLGIPEGHRPGRTPGILLGHGAGNDMANPVLVSVAEELCRRGYLTLRFNFAYKEEGKKVPDRPLRLQAAYRAAYETFRDLEKEKPGRIYAGGKSMGGRIASMLVAGGMPVAGLVFLGYPLHPPGNTDKLRFEHLKKIEVPMLFLQGTRDPLCVLGLLKLLLKRLSAQTTVHEIEGGDHSFEVLKKMKRSPEDVRGELVETIVAWVEKTERGAGNRAS